MRYLPATTSRNVCGDWYTIVDLPPGRYAVAVGDVVGHGLHAAAVMGMLRSALSAVIRALPSPARNEDIDAGPTRLTTALAQDSSLAAAEPADALLTRLGVADGAPDDIALVVIRL